MTTCLFASSVLGQDAPQSGAPPVSHAPEPQEPEPSKAQPEMPGQAHAPVANESTYDKAIFQKPIPAEQLAFLSSFAGAPAKNILRDKQYKKLMKSVIPDVMFHYGSDKPLDNALDEALDGSKLPVRIRDGRYVMVSGMNGPFLAGRGFMWIDMQDGIALGGFYFHPTNGEPTPTVTIFSKQVKEKYLDMSQLPPAFAEDLSVWAQESRVPMITTRYFISGSRRILLEHDEDYCVGAEGTTPPPPAVCEQLNADASDLDLNAAYYLEQIHYATNGTAWMITGADQVAWIGLRDNTCRVGPNPLGCHVRMTREHIHVITNRPPVSHPAPHPVGRR